MKGALAVLGPALAVLSVKAGSPPVKVSLTSSWPAPPVVPEILSVNIHALLHRTHFL